MNFLIATLISLSVLTTSIEAGIIKKTAVVIGVIGAKKAFDKYAKNKFFKSKGKMGDKDVYQQEIDPDKEISIVTRDSEIITETNLEKMQRGVAPYIEKNGVDEKVVLHHSRQKEEGPIFELSESTHKAKSGEGGEALHPFKTATGRENNGVNSESGMSNPDKPVNRALFNKERVEYWKNRAKEIIAEQEEIKTTHQIDMPLK